MSFSQENGYTPASFSTIMSLIREGLNVQFSLSYTEANFVGSGWYKSAYAFAQRLQELEIKTSEIFHKYQEYIRLTNERIQRPSVSLPGIIDSFQNSLDLIASVKKNEIGDAGTVSVCVDADDSDPDYSILKFEIGTLLSKIIPAGMITTGAEVQEINIANGQAFDFKYHLPTAVPMIFKVTLVVSDNNTLTVPTDEVLRLQIFNQINERYRLGLNFEPQRYFSIQDAPWAASVLFEWSDDDGVLWEDEVFEAEFDELVTFGLEDIEVIIS